MPSKEIHYELFLLVILLCSFGNNAEVFDVTTIHRYDIPSQIKNVSSRRIISVEIHARNNARGLPFALANHTYVDQNTELGTESCTAFIGKCQWKMNNFERILTSSSDLPLLISGKKPEQYFRCKDNVTINMRFSKSIEVTVNTTDENGVFGIFLLNNEGLIESSDMYYIFLQNSKMGESMLLKCDQSGRTEYRIPTDFRKRKCTVFQKMSLKMTGGYWKPYYYDSKGPYTFKVTYFQGHMHVSAKWSGKTIEVFNWKDPKPLNVEYYSFGSVSYYMFPTIQVGGTAILALTDREGALTSPSFIPSSNNICVSITYYQDLDTNSQLYVNALYHNENKIDLKEMQTTSMTGGWKTTLFAAKLPQENNVASVKIQVMTTKCNHCHEFLIQRIAACTGNMNAHGDEEVYVFPARENGNLPNTGFDAAVSASTSTQTGKLTCINGGVFSQIREGCVCPAGFTGSSCEIGCGPNIYGSKCDGRCSKTGRGCSNMKLCRPGINCTCASGLKGDYCDTFCDKGEYGADCKLKCGHCLEATCDIYTGLCPFGCDQGYYPPYCQENYRYISIAPEIASSGFYDVKLTALLNVENQKGRGKPKFYQLQYKKQSNPSWLEMEPLVIVLGKVTMNLTGLDSSTTYQTRVVLIDSDGNSYQGTKIPVTEVRTTCTEPHNIQYNLHAVNITSNTFTISWDYIAGNQDWCTLKYFEHEMKEYWGWMQYSQGFDTMVTFENLLPGEEYEVRVRALTVTGPTPYSNVITIKTTEQAPSNIFQLKLTSVKSTELEFEWKPPLMMAGTIRSYMISYQCQKLLACKNIDCSQSAGQLEVPTTYAVLQGLLPHAQYMISVSALAASWGPDTPTILALTEMSEPGISPEPSTQSPETHSTNSSFIVHWEPPQDCFKLNGYLYGYHYILNSNDAALVIEGYTHNTFALFTDLSPRITYIVKVFLFTSGGSSSNPLIITAKTMPTVPGPVEKLMVYKRDHMMLGLKWAAPKSLKDEIETFEISYYNKSNPTEIVNFILKPKYCIIWPNFYCHILQPLQPNTEYTIKVQAKIIGESEYTEPAIVSAITQESSPGAVSYINILHVSQSNLAIEWGIPEILNGVLRFFIVDIEETNSFNSTDCCKIFPSHETKVRAEKAYYRIQFSELRPASTYSVSVTAKTISLGPATTITAYTRPPIPYMDDLMIVSTNQGVISQYPTITIYQSDNYQQLISAHLIIVLPSSYEGEALNGKLWDSWLNGEVHELVKENFYIAAESQPDDLEKSSIFQLGAGTEAKQGKWGIVIEDKILQQNQEYRFGLVVIMEYQGLFSVGYTETETLIVRN